MIATNLAAATDAVRPWTAPVPPASAALAAAFRDLVPRLTTARSVLRAPVLADFGLWCDILCTDRARHIGGPSTPDAAWFDFCLNVASWALRGHGMWTVTDAADVPLGFVLLGFEPGDREPELGYLFGAAAEGRGLATEAAMAARDHATGVLRLPSLVSYVAPENARSAAVARRLGAWRDGTVEGCDVWRHHPKGQG
jgi:RimJ/RimL family protein N-acetyltransferase